MYEKIYHSRSFAADITLTTTAALLNIKSLEKVGILKTNTGVKSVTSLFYGLAGATALKTWNEYFTTENTGDLANFADFSVDTIVILPLVVNIWQVDNKIISYGLYLGVVLGFVPTYISKTSSDIAKYITAKYEKNTTYNSYLSTEDTYLYTTFKGVIPAFVRGTTFCKLKQTIGNEHISALISGSLMTLMIDKSATYTTMGLSIAISGLNAVANRVQSLKFYSPLDSIYPDSTTMIAIEFAEYFLRAAEIEKLIDTTEKNKSLDFEQITTLIQINNQTNDSIKDDL